METIVLYAGPGIGHLVSIVEFGKLILHRYHHKLSIVIFIITGFWDSPSMSSYIEQISQSNPSISFRPFPAPPVAADSPSTGSSVIVEIIQNNNANIRRAFSEVIETSNVRAFIIDVFCTYALPIGKEFKIPTYYFYTSGAAVLSVFLYFPIIHEQVSKSFKDMVDTDLHFPGISPIKATHMPDPMLDRDLPSYSNFLYYCSNLPKSDGILVNTFEEFEPIAVKTIASGACVPNTQTPPVYCIGPLIVEPGHKSDGSDVAEPECLKWLDKQPNRSVVFLCFGSRGSFSVEQVREIANGLEKSEQRFLWVLKKPPSDSETKETVYTDEFDMASILPNGFLERTKDRGMVVMSWAPQVEVLTKEAVGGFVTHCGWNSVLEAVVAGVPMLAWPLYAEQRLNADLMVNDMKVAIKVEQKEEDGFVKGIEVERRVRELTESKEGRELRERALQMKEMAFAAKTEFGSSTIALAKLFEEWKKINLGVFYF